MSRKLTPVGSIQTIAVLNERGIIKNNTYNPFPSGYHSVSQQLANINKINPKCATYVEMHALEAHLGVEKGFGYSSLPIGGTGEMGLHDRTDFMDLLEKAISDFIKLNEHRAAAYYRYSMQMYWDFMSRK